MKHLRHHLFSNLSDVSMHSLHQTFDTILNLRITNFEEKCFRANILNFNGHSYLEHSGALEKRFLMVDSLLYPQKNRLFLSSFFIKLSGAPLLGKLLGLPANIRLGWKDLQSLVPAIFIVCPWITRI